MSVVGRKEMLARVRTGTAGFGFAWFSTLKQVLVEAEKKHEKLQKLNMEFENLLKWFESVPQKKGKEKDKDELLAKVQRQKETFAKLLVASEANITRLRRECAKE